MSAFEQPPSDPPRASHGPRLMGQFSRFAVVGGVNTGIDFLVLNLEMLLTGITSGPPMLLLNSVSYLVGNLNSYLLNKHWTFRGGATRGGTASYARFLAVSLLGLALNGGIVFAVSSFVPPLFGAGPMVMANGGKLAATLAALVWNFIGYKVLVFRR